MYALLRAIAGIALRWYYRDIQVEGVERIPRRRPLLLVVNHPNALVDALIVSWIMPRRILLTGKATLFQNPIGGALLRWIGVVPLRRVSDETADGSPPPDAMRNAETFRAVQQALARRGCVLIFPEGRSWDEPMLAPLKTGAARIALHAHASGDVPELAILPIGLVFEKKDAPRSRVLVTVGEPILVDEWLATRATPVSGLAAAKALTGEIETRLRALTLSHATLDQAAQTMRFAGLVASVLEPPPEIGVVDRGFGVETGIARRIDALVARLANADPAMRARVDQLVARMDAVHTLASDHGLLLADARIDLASYPASRFVAREGWFLLVGGPVAFWGWLNHWLPLRAARLVALRKVESAADPAMRTIVAGAAFVVVAYLAQTAAVGWLLGWPAALLYLVSLPIAADVNFALRDRMRRAARRAHAFLLFRRDPALHARLNDELAALRAEIALVDAGRR